MKKCPYCSEEIKDEAVKCRYCGEWIDKKISAQTAEFNPVHLAPDQTILESETVVSSTVSNNILSENEEIITGKTIISDTIESSFKQFRRIVISLYLGVVIIGLASSYNEAFKPFAVFGYIVLVFYFWTHLWTCARLVGKNPLLWILLSGILSIIGPVVAYSMLKKSAEEQGFIF